MWSCNFIFLKNVLFYVIIGGSSTPLEGDFAFDALTIVLIIGMIYHLKSSNDIKLMEIVLIVLATIITLIVSIINYAILIMTILIIHLISKFRIFVDKKDSIEVITLLLWFWVRLNSSICSKN